MIWNYRVVRKASDNEEYFGIHEVFYNEKKEPYMVTMEPIAAYGESVEDLLEHYEMMKEAFRAPVLDYDSIGCDDDFV